MIVVFVQAAAKPQSEPTPTTAAENPARLASLQWFGESSFVAYVRSDRKSVV